MIKNILKKSLTVLFCSSLLISSYSCSSANTSTPVVNDKTVGSKVDATYVMDHFPQLIAGTKLTYLTKSKVGSVDMSQQTVIEVLETNSSKAKLRVVSGDKSNLTEFERNKPPILPASGITYEGKETITIPAGIYNASKVSFSNDSSVFNAWLIKDIGILKVVEQKKDGLVVTTELIEYKK